MDEEKMRVLEMIQEGKITAAEGASLLEALGDEKPGSEPQTRGRTVKVRVTEKSTGAVKVNLAVPVGIVRFLKDMIPPSERAKLEDHGVDLEAVFANLDAGAPGKLVDIDDEHEGHLVEIWIE